MALPNVFKTAPDATVQYSFTDYISNVGFLRFYPYGACHAAGRVYAMHTQQIDSATADSTALTGIYTPSTAAATAWDIDFDIVVNKQFTLAAGYAYLNFTVYQSGVITLTNTATIYRVRGAAETSIGTITGTALSDGDTNYYRETFRITTTETQFAVGDILRLNITSASSNNTTSHRIYHDPTTSLTFTDQKSRTIGSDATLDIPIKLQT